MSLERDVAGVLPAGMAYKHRPLTDGASEDNPITTAEDAAADMLGRNAYTQANQKTRMTWGERKDYRTPLGNPVPRDRARGLWDRRLGYCGVFPGGFVVQNLRIIKTNGQECKLEDVPEVVKVYGKGRDQRGLVEEFRSRDAIAAALVWMRELAIRENDLLCEFCLRFDASGVKDKARHIRAEHPEKFDDWLGEIKSTTKARAAKAG